jgi:hypothetical protein
VSARTTIAAVLLLGVSLFPPPASAEAPDGPPPGGGYDGVSGVNLGCSTGYVGGGFPHAFAGSLELTWWRRVHLPIFFWASAGGRVWTDLEIAALIPYAEIGLSVLYLDLGAGYGPGLLAEEAPDHGVHLYAGLAIPLWHASHGVLLYAAPYYRPTWDVADGDHPVFHEAGLALKLLIQTSPERRGRSESR